MKKFFINALVSLMAVIFTLVFVELLLRMAYPRYQSGAESQFILSQSRIFKNAPGAKFYRRHPDSGQNHRVIYNSSGFRQHREFPAKKSKDVIRVGFFGDSFTANSFMESQYSFTEPLDYLLNQTGKKYEVMNFGTDGYGTDQVYLQYLQDGKRYELDYLFYVYCGNDLRNLNENNLFMLDPSGKVKSIPYHARGFLNFFNKFYLTYFILEHSELFREWMARAQSRILKKEWEKRFHLPRNEAVVRDFAEGVMTSDVHETLKLFLAIVAEMKLACQKNNVKFYIVTLPFERENKMHGFLTKNGWEALSLNEEFAKEDQDLRFYQFKNDAHWNEEANKLAAIALFKFLAKELSIQDTADNFIEQSLYQYYRSFELDKVTSYLVRKHEDFSPAVNDQIRFKYLYLEQSR